MKIRVTAMYSCGMCLAPLNWQTKSIPRPYRLYYVIGGKAHYSIGGHKQALLSDHFYLFPSSMPLNITQDSEDRLNHLYFDFMMSPSIAGISPLVCSMDDHPMIPTFYKLMKECVCAYRYEGKTELIDTVISSLEAFLSLMCTICTSESLLDSDILSALEYIEQHYAEEISVKSIAEALYLNEDYFIRKFKRTLGITPYSYIKNLRLAVAKELIQGGESLKNAAAAVGFKYSSSYCRAVSRQKTINDTK